MTTLEWANLAQVVAFSLFVTLTIYRCYQAASNWPRGSRRAFFCLACFVAVFGVITVINRLARDPTSWLSPEEQQMLVAGTVWSALLTALVGTTGFDES